MRILSKSGLIVLVLLMMLIPIMAACDDDDETAPPTTATKPTQTLPPTPAEDVEITIGHVTDMTGPGAQAFTIVNSALNDLVEYFNSENLIPGAELKVLDYDGQMDPAKDIPAYEWLLEKGADVIFSGVPATPMTLKSRLETDQTTMFALTSNEAVTNPPGWVFCMTVNTQPFSYTLLKWIAENDWDYTTNGPAKIGLADWIGPYGESTIAGMEAYCDAHPEQFTWEGGFLTNFSPTWGPEVEALKDCDYVMPPSLGIGLTGFIGEYRNAGGKAKFIGFDTHPGFLGMVVDAVGWDSIDGMLFGFQNPWWNEDVEIPNLAEEILNTYHDPDEVVGLMKGGTSYIGSFSMWYACLQVLAETVNEVGPENFTPQDIYDTAMSFSMELDNGQQCTFTESKRTAWNYIGMYAASAAQEDIVRIDTEMHPLIYEP